MNVSLPTAEPGGGAPLHDHECEETFVTIKGRVAISFRDWPEEDMILNEWDAISVPTVIRRGWRNVGPPPDGILMAILAAGKTELRRDRADCSKPPRVVRR